MEAEATKSNRVDKTKQDYKCNLTSNKAAFPQGDARSSPEASTPGSARKTAEKEGRMEDALALGGEEGRDKLRKAEARGKYP